MMRTRSRAGGGLASNQWVIPLSLVLLTSLALAAVTFFHIQHWDAYNARYLMEVGDQQIQAQRMAKYSLAATHGERTAVASLKQSRDSFQKSLLLLKQGSPAEGLPASPPEVAQALQSAERAWQELRGLADKLIANEKSVTGVLDLIAALTDGLPKLQTQSEQMVQFLLGKGASREDVHAATLQGTLLQRMQNNLRRLAVGGEETLAAAEEMGGDMEHFGRVLESMRTGSPPINRIEAPEGQKLLQALLVGFKQARLNVTQLVTLVPDTLPALEAAGKVSLVSDQVSETLEELISLYRTGPGRFELVGVPVGPLTVLILGGTAVSLMIMLGSLLLADARTREAESKAVNEANQKAILRLLDEMGDLADGDLTVTATVTEDITGAIADSINYAIEALRNLVSTINETAVMVSSATQESRATAMHLAEASSLQAQQIAQATRSIKEMTRAIDQMASDAQESAEVAQRSVELAGKGGETVRSTIQGMDTIREQIQETAKRIKRLGESSQEIGDIVELIDDIADQTNILALNAAMQAAMAGEAGRGFAVVADEVQRLAERSSNATKQIEALVKTIQADTNEAVSSMEASTSGVVRGAKLAEDAGDALMEIENVSNYIAELTRKIADSAQIQSQQASKTDEAMGVIQEITRQTSDGTRQTAASVGTLAELAGELQRSVAGFRLPE